MNALIHLALSFATLVATVPEATSSLRFEVTFDSSTQAEPVDGRVILILAPREDQEPRFQARWGINAVPVFGVDVEGIAPGVAAIIDETTFGYPFESIADLPAGDYYVQAVLHKYETFNLLTGHTVKLPMDQGEGQRWNRSPGNLLSTPRWVSIDPQAGGVVAVELDTVIPPIEPPADTKYVRHERIQSELLTEFWGRPMHLGAHVLLPEAESRTQKRAHHGARPRSSRRCRGQSTTGVFASPDRDG